MLCRSEEPDVIIVVLSEGCDRHWTVMGDCRSDRRSDCRSAI